MRHLVLFLILASCGPHARAKASPPSADPVAPSAAEGRQMITKEQAVAIAEQELAKHGLKVSDHDVTVEPHHADPMQWTVWFDRKGPFPVPGGKSAVNVRKVDGEAVYLRGE